MDSTSLRKLDPILATSVVAKLVDSILTHRKSDTDKIHQEEELKLLKEKYISSDTVLSLTASHGMLSLIEEGVLGNSAYTEFISMLPSSKNSVGPLETLSGLLILDLKSQLANQSTYLCPFGLIAPQHPFISVLKIGRDSWLHVLNQISYICYNRDEIVQKYSLDLLKPVFLYILCSPKLYNYSKRQTWSLLVNFCSQYGWNKGMDILLLCISWQQTESDALGLLEFNCMLFELSDAALQSKELALAAVIAPYLASLSQQLFEKGLDPRMCINMLRKVLSVTQDTASEVAVLIAEAIGKCPSLYLGDYMLLCLDIVRTHSCNLIAAKMLLVSLLQWLAFPNVLTRSVSITAQELIDVLKLGSNKFKCSKNVRTYGVTSTALVLRAAEAQRVDFAYIICEVGNVWATDPKLLREWLLGVKNHAPQQLLWRLRLVLSAIVLEGGFGSGEAEQESCELLLRLVESNAELGMGVLTILLYKLAREKKPESQLKLLRCIPAMAMQKENIPLVLSTLESLKVKKSLKPTVVDLYVRLWKVEPRCYPYLQKLLLDDPKDIDWEWELAKATALKEICDLRAHSHGKELLPLISQTLNRCSPVVGKGKGAPIDDFAWSEMASAASALALTGTAKLLKEKIIDACAVWNVLGPKLSRDRRPSVIQSLCKLIALILSLKSPSVEYETLSNQLVAKLWSYVVLNNEKVVKIAALEALSTVNLSQMALKHVPEMFRQGLKLPSAYAKTPVDAARKPEDVLPYTPGECWVQLLLKIQPDAIDAVGQMLKILIKRELISQRGIRAPANMRAGYEPDNYIYLPEHSVLRALIEHLKRTSSKILEQAEERNNEDSLRFVLACLKILAHSYPKPFYPLNWSFLYVFADNGSEYQHLCLCLVIKQAHSSSSARKYVEDKIAFLTPSDCPEDQVQMLFEHLGDICKGIPPNNWRPLIEGCLLTALEKLKTKEGAEEELEGFFVKMLSFCKTALLREDIPDVNRSTIALILETLLEHLDVEDSVFTSFVECVGELPTKYVERMSSPSVWWEVTSDKLRKGARIRCELASRNDSDNPLFWLNEIIDAASTLPGEYIFILKTIMPTLLKCKDQTINCQWILQLMGQIMKMIGDNDPNEDLQAPAFLIDVWILCIICMSGCHCLASDIKKIAINREHRIELFPQALSTILQLPEWQSVSPQMLEWQLQGSISPCVPEYHRTVLYRGILSVHQNPHLLKKNAWMRFLGSKLRAKRACDT